MMRRHSLANAAYSLALALLLALWTGQRQGDLLRLTWPAYDGSSHPTETIQKPALQWGKARGVCECTEIGAPLKAALDEAAREQAKPDHATQFRRQAMNSRRLPARRGARHVKKLALTK